ncbi:MAG: TrkH family potassium uptake protein [Bacteroidales bacterium]|nr:TrkH family potassium uptake protein [Bacteroidales bacterium]
MLMVEGGLILSCLIPALHFGDGTVWPIMASGLFTFNVGLLLLVSFHNAKRPTNRRVSYLLVVAMWVVLPLFGTLPFLSTGVLNRFADALFESTSGVTSTGATVFSAVEWLPSSILLWRSMTQWFGGFGIVLLVLALVPTMGINKYSLYTAEASGADNTGKQTSSMTTNLQQTLGIYLLLTAVFVIALWKSGMHVWDAVNITFTNISSGGFSIYNNSLERLTHGQQYIVALAMLLSGVNFAMLYNFFTFHWDRLRNKLEQLGFYLMVYLVAAIFVIFALRLKMDFGWGDAVRCGVVQTISVLTTTGSLAADTQQWWVPITYLFVVLSLCGGMAGSTTGGLKAMRVLILVRNVRKILRDKLHPHAVNPVRLNHKPVATDIITNVMVIFLVYAMVIFIGIMLLMLSGINATESIGAAIACITGYGPGLGLSGGFGCYAGFTVAAKLICSFLMIMGRLECLTVIILFIPAFWRR